MRSLLLDPHGDDAVLFASYLCLRERPHVIVTHPTVPEDETGVALEVLDCSVSEWTFVDDSEMGLWLSAYALEGPFFERVFAPAIETSGHEEHNLIGRLALGVFGERVTHYLTYAPRGQRSRSGTEVKPEPWMIARKLRALSCFESQIAQESTRPWFTSLLDLREWTT